MLNPNQDYGKSRLCLRIRGHLAAITAPEDVLRRFSTEKLTGCSVNVKNNTSEECKQSHHSTNYSTAAIIRLLSLASLTPLTTRRLLRLCAFFGTLRDKTPSRRLDMHEYNATQEKARQVKTPGPPIRAGQKASFPSSIDKTKYNDAMYRHLWVSWELCDELSRERAS